MTQPYLEDQDISGAVSGPFIAPHLAPRIMFINSNVNLPTSQQLTKFNLVAGIGAVNAKIASTQALLSGTPDAVLGCYQFNPRSYLQGIQTNCQQPHSLPFNSTGPSTQNCAVFAGHWLYRPGTTTSTYLSANGTSVTVANGGLFTVNQYVCIRNGPPNPVIWANAEHCLVTARNGNVLTLQRAFKSAGVIHPAGSVIAPHELGLGYASGGTANTLWAWNTSTQCPADGLGKKASQTLADWCAGNYNRDSNGNVIPGLKIDAIRFDTDVYHYYNTTPTDHNNDLVADNGISSAGVNWWGQGLELFYQRLKSLVPNIMLIGGESTSRGFPYLNGVEIEGWPFSENGSYGAPQYTPDKYTKVDQLLNSMAFRKTHKAVGLPMTFGFARQFSKRFPFGTTPVNVDNACFRFGLGLSLLEDSWFGQDNEEAWPQQVAELWWDEYAVDTVAGANFGKAIAVNPTNEAAVRAKSGWLGKPTTFRKRVYSDVTYSPGNNQMPNGNFEVNVAGWVGVNTTITRDTVSRMSGLASLKSSGHNGQYYSDFASVKVRSPVVPFTTGQDKTLCFSARANAIREIGIRLGWVNPLQMLFIDTVWRRYVVTSRSVSSGSQQIDFFLGRENTPVWLDEVYIFNGNVNLFRRDFQHGVVIVNATNVTQTVSLGATLKRILGTGQDVVNSGASVSSITLGHHDAAFFVK